MKKYISLVVLSCIASSTMAQIDSFCPIAPPGYTMLTKRDSCFLNGLFYGKKTTRYNVDIRIRERYRFITETKELWCLTDTSIIRSSKGITKAFKCEKPFIFMDTTNMIAIMRESDMGTVTLIFNKILNSFTIISIGGFGDKLKNIEIESELP